MDGGVTRERPPAAVHEHRGVALRATVDALLPTMDEASRRSIDFVLRTAA